MRCAARRGGRGWTDSQGPAGGVARVRLGLAGSLARPRRGSPARCVAGAREREGGEGRREWQMDRDQEGSEKSVSRSGTYSQGKTNQHSNQQPANNSPNICGPGAGGSVMDGPSTKKHMHARAALMGWAPAQLRPTAARGRLREGWQNIRMPGSRLAPLPSLPSAVSPA
jgi:hypothetical protein